MNPTIKELIEQHSHLHLDNAEDRKILIDVLTAAWNDAESDSFNDGYEDGYNEGQSECED
jgi:hypothetical protein